MLEHYEPRKFFHWFEKITKIPRPSFHEEKICDFLESFAVSHQLAYHRDAMHNILMRIPASAGYENEPPLLLQSHTDMIAEKDDGVTFDFLKDPIRLKVEGNELRAEGTTLGADDAGGMAIMLSIADSPELSHPELELLFTTQEEVGMHGMQAFDLSLIRSRRMINLDCGRMHNISVSSAGIRRDGIGRDLHEASKAATIITDKGAVAYIAQVCLNRKNESGRAGYSHDGIPARPGVNGLRRIDESLVTAEQMAYIKDLARQTMVNAQEDLEKAYGYGDLDDGTFSYGVMKFRVAEKTGRISHVNELDMQRTESELRNAKRNHEFALVAIHSHQFKALAEDEPDYYLEEYAHRCIDAGADAVIGAGNHLLKGIEIYKDRPIFYGLANFIFQPDYVDKTPADMVEMYGFSLTMSGAEVSAARVAKSTASMERNQIFYLSVVPKWTIIDGKLTELNLLPIELGMKAPWGLRGFPSPVSPELIFDNLQRVCEPFGTKLRINGDTIDVIL